MRLLVYQQSNSTLLRKRRLSALFLGLLFTLLWSATLLHSYHHRALAPATHYHTDSGQCPEEADDCTVCHITLPILYNSPEYYIAYTSIVNNTDYHIENIDAPELYTYLYAPLRAPPRG